MISKVSFSLSEVNIEKRFTSNIEYYKYIYTGLPIIVQNQLMITIFSAT